MVQGYQSVDLSDGPRLHQERCGSPPVECHRTSTAEEPFDTPRYPVILPFSGHEIKILYLIIDIQNIECTAFFRFGGHI